LTPISQKLIFRIKVGAMGSGTFAPKDFSVERFALGVYNELCMALGGLVEENVIM